VQTAGGESYSAGMVVNAAGAWASEVARLAQAQAINITPKRRSAMLLDLPADCALDDWPLCFGAGETFYFKPMGGRLMLSPADATPVDPHDAWADDMALAEAVEKFQQVMDFEVTHAGQTWGGLRSFADDGNPVAGFDDTQDNFLWLAGQGGYGIQSAPALSRWRLDWSIPDSLRRISSLPGLNPQRFRRLDSRSNDQKGPTGMNEGELSIGEALVGLLEAYGVDTVFGIPGVHNVEMYRALPRSGITHILPRHEQGAGFMADGYARTTGKPGVCFTITGPGLTNILTPMGQAYSDSVPMLVISSSLDVKDAGQGRGRLHEMRSQVNAAATVSQLASVCYTARDVQDRIAEAFMLFHADRPRPVYIEIPLDVLKYPAGDGWQARPMPSRKQPCEAAISEAVARLARAQRPVIILGGGARHAGKEACGCRKTGAMVFTTIAAKGAVPDSHPLLAGSLLPDTEATKVIMSADALLPPAPSFLKPICGISAFDIQEGLIRIDIDPALWHAPTGPTSPYWAMPNGPCVHR
jgi:hypothetical protein